MAHELQTKVVGVTFANTKRSEGRKSRQRIIKDAARRGRAELEFAREKGNRHDKNAISVWLDGEKIGHLDRALAAELAPQVDEGSEIEPFNVAIAGGYEDDPEDEPIYGVHLSLRVKPPLRLP